MGNIKCSKKNCSGRLNLAFEVFIRRKDGGSTACFPCDTCGRLHRSVRNKEYAPATMMYFRGKSVLELE